MDDHSPQNLPADPQTQLVVTGTPAPLAPAEQHPVLVYLGGLGPRSRRTMEQALRVAASLLSGDRATWQTLSWGALHYSHVAMLRQTLGEQYAPASANKILCAVRGVLKEAFDLGQMSGEAYQRAAHVKGIRFEVLPAGRALTDGELRALFSLCAEPSRPAAGARDAAVLALLYGLGLRRSEAVAVQIDEYTEESGELTVRRGKGRKDRLGYASGGSHQALRHWLQIRGAAAGPILCPVDRWGRIHVRPMTDQAVRQILVRRGRMARVQAFGPHDLRRTFISNLLEAGADLSLVRNLAGHANIATTARYDLRGERAKQKAAGLLHVPYVAPQP